MSEIGAAFPGGEGAVGELIRAKDWSQTPLGPRDRWSQPLRTSVSICLASRFPMFLWWGHDLINIYNDAYIPLMGAKHPHGLGRPAAEVWAEVWPIIGPLAMDVVERGQASWSEAQLLHLERSGYPEESYFDFAYSPIMDGAGGVAGLLGVVSEITDACSAAGACRPCRRSRLASGESTTSARCSARPWPRSMRTVSISPSRCSTSRSRTSPGSWPRPA